MFDITNVQKRIDIWKQLLPRVEIFYALKCNPDIEILKACVRAGTGFDVAS